MKPSTWGAARPASRPLTGEQAVRRQYPLFIQYDKVPLPTNTNAAVQSIIKQLSEKPSNQCR